MPPKPDAAAAQRRLNAARDRARRRKLGKPLSLSETALEQAAAVQPLDVASAVVFWDTSCPPAFRGLLEAKVVEPGA